MAEAIARSAIAGGAIAPDRLVASDPDPERRRVMESIGVRTVGDNRALLEAASVVVLAVKPQAMGTVLDDIRAVATERHLVISIAAGTTLGRLEAALSEGVRVVRVMPNTPLQVGEGASAVARGCRATDDDMALAMELFASAGLAIEVDEGAMDAVTAVSGSGPAYAFFLAECMMAAGAAEGLDDRVARSLSAATLKGAGALMAAGTDAPEELRRRVTSPGGTTEAAFAAIEEAGVRDSLVSAIRRAARRSRELSST
jgi:pyrroline-5-carboxylate reductase